MTMFDRLKLAAACLALLTAVSCGGGGGGGPIGSGKAKWTVLVYMNAANNLFGDSPLNVNQLETVAGNPQVQFVVQWKQSTKLFPASTFDGTRRYLVQPDNTPAIASKLVQDMGQGVDMGDPATLAAFLDWGVAHYPAERYVLVLWDHGNGWRPKRLVQHPNGFSYDDQTGHAIQAWQITQAMGGHSVDILAWDASLMQMAEVDYEARNSASFIAGSEESPPPQGYPYDTVFQKFRDNPSLDTKTLSKAFVDGMLSVPAYASDKITQSVIDTSKLPAVSSSADVLANALIANVSGIGPQVDSTRNQAQSYSDLVNPPRVYRDIVDLAAKLKANIAIPAVQTAATNFSAATSAAVVWEGHNSNSPNSHGLSIDFSNGTQFAGGALNYQLLQFGQANHWGAFLLVAP